MQCLSDSLLAREEAQNLELKSSLPLGPLIERRDAADTAIEAPIPEILGEDMLATTARIGHMDPEAVDLEFGTAENDAVIAISLIPYGRRHSPKAWVEFLKAKSAPEISIVAWANEDTSRFVFVNRRGVKTNDISVEELATLMHDDQLKLLEESDIPITEIGRAHV